MCSLLLAGCVRQSVDPGDTVSAIEARVHADYGSLVYVQWEQGSGGTAWVEYSFDTDVWESSPMEATEAGAQEALLLGIPYASTVFYRVCLDEGEGAACSDEGSITSDALPDGVPTPLSVTGDPALWDAEVRYLFLSLESTNDNEYFTLIVDREARVVWARESPRETQPFMPRLSVNGSDLLIDESTFWTVFDKGASSSVLRMKIDGTVLNTYPTPGLHHGFTDLDDGSLVWTATEEADDVLTRLSPDGESKKLWHCKSFMAEVGLTGVCGSNSVIWLPESNRYLISFYSMDTVVEVDSDAGDAVRWFGRAPGSWGFMPPDSGFWWQHGARYTEEGTLLLSSHLDPLKDDIVVREYALEKDDETLVEVYNFDVDAGIEADVMGDALRLPGGNTLHNCGSAVELREGTPDGELAWSVAWPGEFLGTSTPLSDLYDLAP